ncbi:ATP-binding protein [Gordonia sp. CPCC 206044]|uniref:AlbA family DNA-binding domain-containing protein n=1 Tax=Gordonia sp. CPCC 206044 TaxID=3140793 RepID=UPI003AF3ECCF
MHESVSPVSAGPVEITHPLWAVAAALVIVLAISVVFGTVARTALRRRARLDLTTSMVLSILGSAVGLFLAGVIDPDLKATRALTVVLALLCSVAAVAVYGAVVARLQHKDHASVTDLLAAGESDRVEFKSTARVNLRTGDKDPRMEHVIAKTVSAFLNTNGGTLLIGVDDAGTPLGLDPDYATLKVPDADRFELWLRDLLGSVLGQNAAAEVSVLVEEVPTADGAAKPVCRVGIRPSARPVYLRAGKNAATEFWVRSGNSTRQLTIDQAAEYIMYRWPLSAGAATAAQIRAAVRFSIDR